MNIFEREVGGRRYRIASQSLWDPAQQRPYARQVVLGPADPPGIADLGRTRTVGERRVGDVGALLWVAEHLDVVGVIDRACGQDGHESGPSIGEMALAVAIQRVCAPGAKRDLSKFLDGCLPRVSCLPGERFSGQAFHRLAKQVSAKALESAQINLARGAITTFELSTHVLALDTTNFDTFIATTTQSKLAQRGHAKSKRKDLRVVGLAVLVSETGHVPLLHHTYPGNASDQAVLRACLGALGRLHEALEHAEDRSRAQRTVVRDGGFWKEQLELDLDGAGYGSLISLPLSHGASKTALEFAAQRGKMKKLRGSLSEVRAARLRTKVGELDRTLVVVESQALLRGQKRGIAVALRKAKKELQKLQRRAAAGRIDAPTLQQRITKALAKEHLSTFVVARVRGTKDAPKLTWEVDKKKRLTLERTRLGRRVLCTDRHAWNTERIVRGFRGQWNVEEIFRRAKKGGVAPWGPSYQWADTSLRFHTFCTVLGLSLVSLVRLHLRTDLSVQAMMQMLAAIRVTLVRTSTGTRGRRPTVPLPPELTTVQRKAIRVFELERWAPRILSSSSPQPSATRPASRKAA